MRDGIVFCPRSVVFWRACTHRGETVDSRGPIAFVERVPSEAKGRAADVGTAHWNSEEALARLIAAAEAEERIAPEQVATGALLSFQLRHAVAQFIGGLVKAATASVGFRKAEGRLYILRTRWIASGEAFERGRGSCPIIAPGLE